MSAMRPDPRQQPQPDEGFHSQPASDTTSQPDESMVMATDDVDHEQLLYAKLRADILSLPGAKRLKLMADICDSFPTAILFDLHNTIGALVYFDPVQYLPTELVLQVFAHLAPKDILTASLVSRPWRERSHDERLWRDCFGREGWILDRNKMTRHEDLAKRKGGLAAERFMRKGALSLSPRPSLERRESRKRVRDEAFNSENEGTQAPISARQAHIIEEDLDDSCSSMSGVEAEAPPSAARSTRSGHSRPRKLVTETSVDMEDHFESNAVQVHPPMFSASAEPKVSWPYLYKQRRRLEKNWELGKYKMFQLPHPEHAEEGHRECVYTIQHSGSWVVSGSRDRSIRIWDLSTDRLKVPPLEGHQASVLCLQFDERPDDKHDIIVSGGSDNYVIVWKFSTGQLVKKWKAHDESVLNLRFDDRYLVTCSKDKTIKIWNRRSIKSDDPMVPRCSVDQFDHISRNPKILEPYELLKTMTGHQAAVNAVQIHGDIIVSASGDRTIRSWNIHEDHFKRSYTGHTKGIACVQFDGRRIVSGSSDNSVRIFDFDSSAEVACLDGHSNLVRTVQARFGDLQTSTDDDLAEESRRIDEDFLKRLDQGMRPAEASRRRRPRNAGSSRPEDMLAFGTKIPPGGGGSRWAKIVSGSYDETVIVWKRNKDGNWNPSLRLHQGMLLNHPTTTRVRATAVIQPANLHNINAQLATGQPAGVLQQTSQHLMAQAQHSLTQVNAMLQNPPTVQNQGQAMSQTHVAAVNAAQASLAQQAQTAHHNQQPLNHVTTTHGTIPTANGSVIHTTMTTTHSMQQPTTAGPANQGAAQPAQPAPAPQAPQAGPANNGANAAAHGQHHHHGHHHHHHGQAGNANGGGHRESNRVFKLQFDARRIISCSQNKVIVGWDFANGEKDLEWIGDWSVETA